MVRRHTIEEQIEKFKKVHGDLYSYLDMEYVDTRCVLTISCKHHGNFKQRADMHLRGSGCQKCSKMYSPNSSEFVSKLEEIYGTDKYDFSRVDYKTRTIKVTIGCRSHGDFRKSPEMLLRGGEQCNSCVSDNKTKNFIKQSIHKHGDVYDYSISAYKNPKTKVKIMCKTHGTFEQLPYNHSYHGFGCLVCFGNPRSDTETFIEKAKSVHGSRYDYSLVKYSNNSSKVTIICNIHGEFSQRPSEHLAGKGCIKCAGVERLTTEQFIESSKKIHGDRYDYSKVDYINNRTKVTIVCDVHGDFDQVPDSHLRMNTGCPKCTINKAESCLDTLCNEDERIICNGRDSLKCIDIHNNNVMRCLFPDKVGMTMSGKKFIIECDGPQHFQPISWYGNELSDFRDQVCRDLAKNLYARDNNWSMLRISYLEYHNIRYWFDRFISAVESSDNQVFMCSNPSLYSKLRSDNLHMLEC